MPALAKAQAHWEHQVAARCQTTDWTVTEGLALPLSEPTYPLSMASISWKRRRQRSPTSTTSILSHSPSRIKPDCANGAILSHSEDYFEGPGHGLYLIDGKLRLHVIIAGPISAYAWKPVAGKAPRMAARSRSPTTASAKPPAFTCTLTARPAEAERLVRRAKLAVPREGEDSHSRSARRVASSLKVAIRDFRIYERALTSQEAGGCVRVADPYPKSPPCPKPHAPAHNCKSWNWPSWPPEPRPFSRPRTHKSETRIPNATASTIPFLRSW